MPLATSSSIFRSQLATSEQLQPSALYTGMVRSLADLAKAAYDLTHPLYSEYVNLNDHSPYSEAAWQQAYDAGWQPLTFAALPAVNDRGAIQYGMTRDGFFINQNAAALVMRSADAVVISFRGTNDYSEKSGITNPYDPNDVYHPDYDQWTAMDDHYTLLTPLIRELDAWVAANGLAKVYVTGHSMGGAMALEYMNSHSGEMYEAVTFAATPFGQKNWLGVPERKSYPNDSRITQLEVELDTAPMMFDATNLVGGTNNRPGRQISFVGDQTLDSPDQIYQALGLVNYWGRTANHSMDYYRQMVDSLDAEGWQAILDSTGDTNVLLGGRNEGDDQTFVVDGRLSGSNSAYDNGADQLSGNYRFIWGGRGQDQLQAGNSGSHLLGGASNDTLISGSGNDTLDGGNGIDTADYHLASSGVTLSLASAAAQAPGTGLGLDVLRNIENLLGSNWADRLTGNRAANQLTGGAGADTLLGAAGNDTLDGGTGSDLLAGGSGNDRYLVDDREDQLREGSNAGIDTVISAINWTLGDNFENLTLTGTQAYVGYGNSANNRIIGNALNNRLSGFSGNDTLDGRGGNDTLYGGYGDDTYLLQAGDVVIESAAGGIDTLISSTSRTLGNHQENLTLTGNLVIHGWGNALDNLLTGNGRANRLLGAEGNDTLNGQGGIDTLAGGTGDDTYILQQAGDVVIEQRYGGNDLILSQTSRTLGAWQENLTLTGTLAIHGHGNSLDNLIRGNVASNRLSGGQGADSLFGGSGNDQLYGNAGADKLNGGAGQDRFVYTALADSQLNTAYRDTITDFQRGLDRIDLSALDANLQIGGNQSFTSMLASDARFSAPGQLRFSNGVLQGNVDNDSQAEFAIALSGVRSLSMADLIA